MTFRKCHTLNVDVLNLHDVLNESSILNPPYLVQTGSDPIRLLSLPAVGCWRKLDNESPPV